MKLEDDVPGRAGAPCSASATRNRSDARSVIQMDVRHRIRLFVVLACGLAGLWAGASIGGAGLPLPTLSLPTTLPVSLPTLPGPPPPPPPQPPPPPAPQPPPPPAPQPRPPPPPSAPAPAEHATHAVTRQARVKGTAARRAAAPRHVVAVKQPKPAKRTERAASAYKAPKAALPSGILSTGSLLPTAQKLPFLAIALVGLAILLLALGALPVGLVANPAFAEALVERRLIFAFGGLATLAAAIAAYLLV